MKIGKTTGWLITVSASLFMHVAALSVAKLFIPRGRNPATEAARERTHPVELVTLGLELETQITRPQVTLVPMTLLEIARQETVQPTESGPTVPEDRAVEKPSIPRPRRSAPGSATVAPEPAAPPPPTAPAPPAEQSTTWITVNGQPFPIQVEAPAADSPVTMPVGYFLAYPGGLATEPTSQEVIREVALESMRRAELNPTPVTSTPQPVVPQGSRDQLLTEGCWVVQNGTGIIQCPSGHPASQPHPVYQETEHGFMVGMHDPSVTDRSSAERRYSFERQTDGSYLYRDPDGRNFIIIRADGRMEDGANLIRAAEDQGLVYPVFDVSAGTFPWDRPPIPHYIWSEIEESTRGIRRRMAEQNDIANTGHALDNLSPELLGIIRRHKDWSLPQQHSFLFRRWDECNETGGGYEARSIIEQYIREHYPLGSPQEFTSEEQRGFNARRKTEGMSFCPYGCLPGMTLDEPRIGNYL